MSLYPKSFSLSTLKVYFQIQLYGVNCKQYIEKDVFMDWENVGKRIRKQRELLGYTREALAEKLEITPKFCSDIELGLKGMSVPTLCRISEVLGLSTDYILFGTVDDDGTASMIEMVKRCPNNKKQYLENIIRTFVQSCEK